MARTVTTTRSLRARPAAVALLATAPARAVPATVVRVERGRTREQRGRPPARGRADPRLASPRRAGEALDRTCAAPAEIADRKAVIRAPAPGARRVPAAEADDVHALQRAVCVVARVRSATVAWPRWPPASVTVTVSTSRLAWSGAA